jgi:hypothetical protein
MQTVKGFLDALANKVSALGLSLTKGTNFFAEVYIDDPDVITDQVVMFDEGFEEDLSFRHRHLRWNIRFYTTRTKRIDAVDALIPLYDKLLNEKRYVATSDSSESFTILKTRSILAPDLVGRADSGRFGAAFTVQFELIPD